MYIDKTMREYLDDLAAKKPAPGGGSAAGLGASLGVSLLMMVANYTVGNPKYIDAQKKAADFLVKAGSLKDSFQDLIDEDAQAYDKLSKAIKNKKDASSLEVSYKEAMEPPFKICKLAYEALVMCKDIASFGNKNLITDTAIAAILLEGAFFGSKFNVYINLKYIKDIDFVGNVHDLLSGLEKQIPNLKEEILEMCEDVISK